MVTPSVHTHTLAQPPNILASRWSTDSHTHCKSHTTVATNSCGAMMTMIAVSPICSTLETHIHKCAQSPCKWLKPNGASSDWCKPERGFWVGPFSQITYDERWIWDKAEKSGALGINVLSWTGWPGQPPSLDHFISCCSVGAQSQKDSLDSA